MLRPKSEEDHIKEESLNTSVEDALDSSIDEESMNISVDDALLQLDFFQNQVNLFTYIKYKNYEF